MKSSEELRNRLRSIDHRGYPAYKDLKGEYDFGDYVLSMCRAIPLPRLRACPFM